MMLLTGDQGWLKSRYKAPCVVITSGVDGRGARVIVGPREGGRAAAVIDGQAAVPLMALSAFSARVLVLPAKRAPEVIAPELFRANVTGFALRRIVPLGFAIGMPL